MLFEGSLRQQVKVHATKLAEAVAAAEFWYNRALRRAEKDHQDSLNKNDSQYQRAMDKARTTYEAACKGEQRRLAAHKANYEQALADASSTHERIISEQQQVVANGEQNYRQKVQRAQLTYDQRVETLTNKEPVVLNGLLAATWDEPCWDSWQPMSGMIAPDVVRVGQLVEPNASYFLTLPALLPMIGNRPLLFKTYGASERYTVQAIQSLLLRLLGTIPPGKLRFTFIDPVGLGQNVAAFMHLKDYDEELITSKTWTEPQHIEQRLLDLTEHIETVIQTYLRSKYNTIEEYNKEAGEVAEPYQVLVVMDFPVNFSETAARRLVSIMQNGPRCGVYAVVMVDQNKMGGSKLYNFNLNDLANVSTVIAWNGQRQCFVWENDSDFANCQLILDAPPSLVLSDEGKQKNIFTRIIEKVGKGAREGSKVEVPFEKMFKIFPAQLNRHAEDYPGLSRPVDSNESRTWWHGHTKKRLIALLGRVGAKAIQCLDLGKGTAQHALIAGKTGSGKSTLLHVLITSLALSYSPDEVQLYLIDFKKGVEFKRYATLKFPHARVIAIESEREFGLSVLEGLDAELKQRGDLFRAVGVNSLADYRQKSGQVMPRILLLVDEFQEFFAEDDRLASQVSQILDRLVRQGRSFGIHLLLGSQTLAGAYSLARSTMDQMAVRIALQCSDADSRLILADDNAAARLLSRPGEAIYNAANGMVEGNNRFQVAWLPDDERDGYLERIRTLAEERGYTRQPIVFEGNAPAEVEKNQRLHALLTSSPPPTPSRAMPAWLGDPIAIRDAVAATFRRQSGSNLLMVGQDDEAALGMMAISLISLAAQTPQSQNPTFYILNFASVDAPQADLLPRLAKLVPHTVKMGRRRQLSGIMNTLAGEVKRRLEAEDALEDDFTTNSGATPPIYLLIYGLQRARDLRQDDSFGGSFPMPSFESNPFDDTFEPEPPPPNPSQQFPTILRDGPEVDVHTIMWCDTVTNLNRTLDSRSLRECVMRVAFQMSSEDSTNLVDTPAASKLGQHRALFYDEEENRMEKFRPYGIPPKEWLEWVGKQLRRTKAK
ncbi:MAG: FtsK/SpoIIIE domain-containing protein [Ardenticatenaceae bacterium]